jgi:phosphoglycolate phosphatase-like HAD superfamily hydrolase
LLQRRSVTAALPRVRPKPRRPFLKPARRAVILDLEGTLLDSKEAQALSWLVALHESGHDVPLELLRPLIGMTSSDLLRIAAKLRVDTEAGQRILLRRADVFRTWYLRRLLPFMGARALLQRMRREGLRLVAATSACAEEAIGLVRAAGIGDLLDDAVAPDDALGETRLADIVESAIERCACVREGIVLLADSPYDVEAGSQAGISVVGLRCGGWPDGALDGVAAIYDEPRDLLMNFESSPFHARSPQDTSASLSLLQ